ncbi:hypothetical protein [Sporosarcina beigongshangi]|uniref:hypothetical protein n=1 Tax=Sporosarcina beigongshangi TaxID=2782538 RepID=UPI001939978A|nr:hypothetical protein [Sporosarcina beigongshangi]
MDNNYLSVKQTLEQYGLTSSSLTMLRKAGIPTLYRGKKPYFLQSELDQWFELQREDINKLKSNAIIDNETLAQTFKCSPQGGMRRSHKTTTLVLVMNHTLGLYLDNWQGNILHYTGMGQTGDQTLTGNQNITLFESDTNKVDLHLFEVHKSNRYQYTGRVKLAGTPYQVTEKDTKNNNRLVWKFPLSVIHD